MKLRDPRMRGEGVGCVRSKESIPGPASAHNGSS